MSESVSLPHRFTVLIVDDEPELREIFALWLDRDGYDIVTAANGVEALQLLTTHTIDALITDIRMPVMDGITLVRRIFEMRLRVPSILFISGFNDVNVREMYALGVEAMMAKPLARKDLLAALGASLKQRELLWLTPATTPVTAAVELSFDCLEEAISGGEFGIGRGGICVRCNRAFVESARIELSVAFVRDGLRLQAQGVVRWSSPKDLRTGVEFLYLDPACRGWMIPRMEEKTLLSFIPSCGAPPGCGAT